MAHQKAARSPSTLCLAATLLSVLCFASAPAGAQAVGPSYTTPPSITYGEFYRDVELAAIFPDSKTFPDMIPDAAPTAILDEYRAAKGSPAFDLTTFVQQHFTGPTPPGPTVNPAPPGRRLLDYVTGPVANPTAGSYLGAALLELAAAALSLCPARRPVSRPRPVGPSRSTTCGT